MTRNQEIAAEILRQLGGQQRLVTFCGARDFLAIENGVRFKLPSNMTKDRITHFEVVLDPSDLYVVKTLKLKRRGGVPSITESECAAGVYNDQLMDTFEAMTGMFLTLGARR